MLVVSRRPGQSILIGRDIEVFVLEVDGMQVRVGINAPRSIRVLRRELLTQVEGLRSQRKGGGDPAEARALRHELKRLEQDLAAVEAEIDQVLPGLPNLPDPSAPDGETEEDAEVLREVGDRPELDFEPRDHLELGVALGVIDMESAARASGSRFAYLKGDLVRLELALVALALEKTGAQGFVPVVPPVLVREEPLFWTGFLLAAVSVVGYLLKARREVVEA